MLTKYVCDGLISLHINFHDNRTKWTVTSNKKICRWGEKEKEPNILLEKILRYMKNVRFITLNACFEVISQFHIYANIEN